MKEKKIYQMFLQLKIKGKGRTKTLSRTSLKNFLAVQVESESH